MQKHSLKFCFKGSRNYIHGTDIFNKFYDLLQDEMIDAAIDLSFHGVAKTNMDVTTHKPNEDRLLKAAFKYNDLSGNRKVLYAVENGQTIECRYDYYEEEIYKHSKLDIKNQTIVLSIDTSYTFVEKSVALNKYLLEKIFPEVDGKWYFTRFQLSQISECLFPLRLELKANFNFKLTKTEIFVENKSVGFIYFSLV